MRDWVRGMKHENTPEWVFKNVWGRDRLRFILKSRCALCDIVVTADEKDVKELAISKCGNPECRCRFYMTQQAHTVCNVCYDMFHSLYMNPGLKNMNYFKEIDEKEAKDKGDDTDRRKRMRL